MRWDFFYRHESNRVHPKSRPAECLILDLPADTPLAEALQRAHAAGMPKGTHRSGCFEVQTDAGIYQQTDGNRIDLTTPRRAAKTTYRTWEEMA